MSAAIQCARLHVRHPEADFDSVRDVSLDVRRGEVLALLGPNGSGKSTLLRAIGRELSPRLGKIEFDGKPLAKIPRRKLARTLARLPQEPLSPEGLLVEELVELGRHPHLGPFSSMRLADHDVVADALHAVELGALRTRAIDTLSGGERRRAWIAMALAQEPQILLLDEPTSALDLRHQYEVLDLLVRLNRERGTTIVVAIHDLEQAARIADRVALLCRGRLYDVGEAFEVLTEEALLDVFRVQSKISASRENVSIDVLGPGDPIRSF